MPRTKALSFIDFMLPTLVEEPPAGDDWIHEIKHDGYRTELILEAGTGTIVRNQRPATGNKEGTTYVCNFRGKAPPIGAPIASVVKPDPVANGGKSPLKRAEPDPAKARKANAPLEGAAAVSVKKTEPVPNEVELDGGKKGESAPTKAERAEQQTPGTSNIIWLMTRGGKKP